VAHRIVTVAATVDGVIVLDDSQRISDARRGDRLSEILPEHLATTACALAKTTAFSFPPGDGKGGGVNLAIIENLPPTNGSLVAFTGHVLSLHLGRPLAIRQRREDISHAWTFTRGDLSLIPAGWRTTVWTEKPADFLQVELCPDLVRRSAGGSARAADLPCLFSFDDPVCRELLLSMAAEAEAHGPAARMYVESAAVVLSQRLLSRDRQRIPTPSRPGLPPALLRRAKDFLHEEMYRNPGVTELSAAVGMNVDHFSRMFKRSTGIAPHQYLDNIRLERAKQLLAEGRTAMIDIAYEIGYANPSQFSSFFRKRTGLSPTEFRRNVQTVPPSPRR
jgi:AraC family transcriptional regulator